ncbi:MAG: hypothetical protein H0X66_20000 [Verrucomicrobia bacterium]|nr:hypothetical protein [Verrucomicrobiota bacterium]
MQSAEFVVSLSSPSTEVLAVRYETIEVPGSPWPDDYENQSATAGSDFIHTNGLLTFNPGEISKTISVQVIGDEIHEYNEGFVVRLIQASSAPLDRSQARGVILNDDILEITINDVSILEGDNGTTVATFTISLSRPTQQYLAGSWSTSDSSARSGSNNLGNGGYIDFNPQPGKTNVLLPISVYGDKVIADDETFLVNLSVFYGTDVQVSKSGTCTVINDDFFLKTESSSAEEITFRLEGALGATHVIEYSTNMIDWVKVSTNTLFPDRVLHFATDNKKQGFYRASLQQ